MFLSENYIEKWSSYSRASDLPKTEDNYKKAHTVILENQEKHLHEDRVVLKKLHL